MIRKKFVPLVLCALAIFSSARSQEKTNLSVLREAAVRSNQKFQDLRGRLSRLARQNGWPLYITLKKGNIAILNGLSPKGMPVYVATNDNIISAATIGTNQLWPGGSTGLGLSGSNPALKGKLAIWDGGRVLATHQELTGRILQKDNPSALSDHSTHVSGTLIASGVNPEAKGMSFGAQQLIAYDFNNDVGEMYTEAPNLLISNHSYGELAGWNYNTDKNRWEFLGDPGDTVDYKFGYYSDQTQAWDSIAYNAPFYLIVKSVGNDRDENGPAVGQPYYRYNASGVMAPAGNRPGNISSNDSFDIVPTYGTAKNIISMGAVNPIPGGYSKPSDVVLSSFSSWGPADDGRIKPDLVADGVNVLSSISTSNNAYAIYSGTSMSSPAAAGSAFLLQEYYYKLHGSFMRSATLKGILIHTADEAGPADGPDYKFGYGLIDMPKAASVIKSGNTDQLVLENTLANGATFTKSIIASGKGPLTATISWTDPAAVVDEDFVLNNPARKLVNDLDIRIVSNGTTYTPWVLDRLHAASPATHGDDTLNNLEKIVIPNTIPGQTYTIQISHKRTLRFGQQAYSLIVSGVNGSNYCASAPTSTAGTRIDEFILSNIDQGNPVGTCTGYTDLTGTSISLQASKSYPYTVKLSSCDATTATRILRIYIDYNNTGTFNLAAESPVLPGGTYTYNGTLTVPAGVSVGNNTRLRLIAQEVGADTSGLPCGNYANGETQDYTVNFVSPGNDVGMSELINPLSGACATDSQYVSVRIKNFGSISQQNFPIHLKILSGTTTLIDITTKYPDTVTSQGSAIYTFQMPIAFTAGSTYVIQTGTQLPGDQNPLNDAVSDTISISTGSETVTGSAEICSTNPPLAGLKANTSDNSDAVFWFDTENATTPIASGVKATTSVIPGNNTYYMGLNESPSSVGPATKDVFGSGGYNFFQGNFIKFHNDVPVTISTSRLYVGAGGKLDLIVADLASYDSCTGAFSYFPISENIIDVYPTTTTPSRNPANTSSANDTGAVYLLNLPVPTPGDHVIIVVAEDSAFLFRNNNLRGNPYPMGIPGVFTITGNSAINTASCKDSTFFQRYYYFFYDMRITLDKCPSPRVPVVAKTPAPAIITRNGDLLTSNYASGNQWYYNDTLLIGHTGQTDSVRGPGFYYVTVSDSVGCTLRSNEYSSVDGLIIAPNPTHGTFSVEFFQTDAANVNVRVLDINGKQMFTSENANFKGAFKQTIHLESAAKGVYVVQVQIGNTKQARKIIIY